MVVIRW